MNPMNNSVKTGKGIPGEFTGKARKKILKKSPIPENFVEEIQRDIPRKFFGRNLEDFVTRHCNLI